MGSSTKKHKSEKRRKRSRSPEAEKERHRHHKKHKSHRHKQEEVQTITSSDSDIEEVPAPSSASPPPPPQKKAPANTDDNTFIEVGKSHETLSVEQTNALRARLGLKPLQVETPSSSDGGQKLRREGADGTDMGEFVHKPPENISQKAKTEKIRQKLAERKEKRAIEQKMLNVKRLGECDDDVDDTKNWVKKLKEKEQQKKAAEMRAKMLEEMDKEFGIGELVEEDRRFERQDLYNSRDLRGLKIAHSFEGFEEGMNVILTLKDKNVLDEDKDTLVNVNMVDNEKYKKNIERKKKKPGVYDDDDDFDPLLDEKKQILSKYDEEIEGEREESFAIGEELTEAERLKKRMAVKKRLMAQKSLVDLNSDIRLASDYFTEEEISAKFRKPGKAKKLRKKPKKLTADQLLPLQDVTWPSEDIGNRRSKKNPVGIKTEDDMDIAKQEIDIVLDVDDIPAVPDDLYNVKIEPDEAEQELQLALNKARKLKQKEVHDNPVEKIAKEIIEGGSGYNLEGPGGSIVLNSTAEFCRTLGDIPTYGLSGNREEENELLDFERYMKEDSKNSGDDQKNRGSWSQVETDDHVEDNIPTDVAILDEEPDVGKGLAGALRLALSKGYLEKETVNRPSASRFAHLQAQNYSIDDKAHVEDDKFGRRERFSGPTSDFKEKDNYKPNVKLAYIDDDGRILGSKEAFRYLSHKFHGKGPGKNKVEKRMKKNEQEGLMKQMSSTDTPLRTLTMLQKKQKATQSPYVVLSGKGLGVGSTVISKTK